MPHEEAERLHFQAGDFLIARGNGSLALVGRGGFVHGEIPTVLRTQTL